MTPPRLVAMPVAAGLALLVAATVAAQGAAIPPGRSLAWEQPQADFDAFPALAFALYIDGARQALANVTCAPAADPTLRTCSAPAPAMTPGPHALQLAAIVDLNGAIIESAKSDPLSVVMVLAPATPTGLRVK